MRIWTSRSLTLLVQRCSHTRLFTPAVPCLFTLAVPTNNTVRWADSVVFVYPTWWFNMPAILKGYLDRSLCLGGAFDIPTTKDDITAMNGAAAAPKHKGYREGGGGFDLTTIASKRVSQHPTVPPVVRKKAIPEGAG